MKEEKQTKRKKSEIGKRLSELRKKAGLTQVELSKQLGIPQRTLAFYELDAQYLPSHLLPELAKIFNVSIEEILGMENNGTSKKRGPKSQLEKQMEKISNLPKSEQQKILPVIEAFINQHSK